MSLSLNTRNVHREKKKKDNVVYNKTLDHLTLTWKQLTPLPHLPILSIETWRRKIHLRTLRLWCELCVIVCPCFLDDCAERGRYLNTRINKDSLQSNLMASITLHLFGSCGVLFFFLSLFDWMSTHFLLPRTHLHDIHFAPCSPSVMI